MYEIGLLHSLKFFELCDCHAIYFNISIVWRLSGYLKLTPDVSILFQIHVLDTGITTNGIIFSIQLTFQFQLGWGKWTFDFLAIEPIFIIFSTSFSSSYNLLKPQILISCTLGIHAKPSSSKLESALFVQFIHRLDYHTFTHFNRSSFSNIHSAISIECSINNFPPIKISNVQLSETATPLTRD